MPRKPAPKLRYTQEDVDAIIRAVLASSPPADMQRQISELMEEIRVLRAERLREHQGFGITDSDVQPVPAEKKRRGRPLGAKGPVSRLARMAGVPMSRLAEKAGIDYTLVKQWNSRESIPAQYRETLTKAAEALAASRKQ